MAAVSKAANKLKFQTGDIPTESDFIDLIDSYTDATHASDTGNPHSVTKTQVGLGSVDNTSDVNKPVSAAQQTAIDTAFAGMATRLAAPVADLAALKAINTTSSTTWPDKIMILAEAIGQYRLDRDSSATGDDNGVVQPTTGVGRWIKLNIAGGTSFNPATDNVGDITPTNTVIADNDTVSIMAGKAQGQITEIKVNNIQKFGGTGVLLHITKYDVAVNITAMIKTSGIAQVMISINGGTFNTLTFPTAIAAGDEVGYKLAYNSDAYQIGEFTIYTTNI